MSHLEHPTMPEAMYQIGTMWLSVSDVAAFAARLAESNTAERRKEILREAKSVQEISARSLDALINKEFRRKEDIRLDKILYFVQEKIWYSVGFELRKRFSKSFKKFIHHPDGTTQVETITWYQYQREFGTPHFWGEFEHVDVAQQCAQATWAGRDHKWTSLAAHAHSASRWAASPRIEKSC